MTANHAHTPTKGDLKKAWDWYRAHQDKQSGIEQNFRAYRFEFLRAWEEIQAAAEQRGAERALREAAAEANSDGWHETNHSGILDWMPSEYALQTSSWLERRADQMEGDCGDH